MKRVSDRGAESWCASSWHLIALGLGFFFAVSSCRREVLLPVEVLGASAFEDQGTERTWWFDRPASPRLLLTGVEVPELAWSTGAQVKSTSERRGEDLLLRVEAPPADGPNRLELRRGRERWSAPFVFRPSPFLAPSVEAVAELAASDLEAARVALAELPREEWPWGCVEVARRTPFLERPRAYLSCAQGAELRGFVSEGASRRIAALFWARELRMISESRAIAAEASEAVAKASDARLESQLAYQLAILARELADLRGATRELERAIAIADRIQEEGEATLYRVNLAGAWSELGLHARSLELVRSLPKSAEEHLSPRDAATLAATVGWVELAAHAALGGDELLVTSRAHLLDASARLSALDLPRDVANVEGSLAYLEVLSRDPEAARKHIAQARSLSGDERGTESAFLDRLAAELELDAGRPAAAAAVFRRGLEAAELEVPGASSDERWRAQLGLARAALAQGDKPCAHAALAQARALLSRNARSAGEPASRVAFLEDRRRLFSAAVDAFVRAGELEAAWRIADEGQALLFRGFENDRNVRLARLPAPERERWSREESLYLGARAAFLAEAAPEVASNEVLAKWRAQRKVRADALAEGRDALDELLDRLDPRPAPLPFERSMLSAGEAIFETFPVPGGGRRGFWITARSVELVDPDLSRAVDGRSPTHVYVVSGGAEGRVAAARVNDRPLIETTAISFIPYASWLAQPIVSAAGRPLVIADPRRDLPHARAEGREVARVLDADLLLGNDADLQSVLDTLEGRRVVHFAGHGRLVADAPWSAHLELANGQVLDFEMVLVRRPRLGVVVLSGCETGRAAPAPADAIGLPEALLAAGARAVLATDDVVDDAVARRFVTRFYENGGAERPAHAYRRAALESEAAGDLQWRVFRLFGRADVGLGQGR